MANEKLFTTDPLFTVHCKEKPVFEYLGYEYGDFPESEKASREVLSLPMHPFLSNVDLNKVVEILKRVS